MPGNLSEKELNEFHELFKLVDTDGRGYISRQELRKLMDTLHLQPTEEELETLFDEAHSFAPASGNASTSRIDVKQFVEVMSRRVQSDYTPEQLRNAFKVFSTDDLPEGYVSTVVIRHALVTYASEKLSVEEADRLLDAVDPEGTGMINYYDFVSLSGCRVLEKEMQMSLLPRSHALKLAYKVHQPNPLNASAGTNVYIAHGLLGNAMNWTTPARRLVDHPSLKARLRSIYALDMRNHGDSPHSADHTNSALASDVERVVLEGQKSLATQLSTASTPSSASPSSPSAGSVLMGHSMGGLAVMGTLLRRYNEGELLSPCESQGTLEEESGLPSGRYGHWADALRWRSGASMQQLNTDMGYAADTPLRDVLFADPFASSSTASPSSVHPHCGRISAAVVVDVTPTVHLGEQRTASDNTQQTLDRMVQVNLSHIHSYSDAEKELIRVGMTDKGMRDFVTTNIVLNPKQPEAPARWRCNLDVLAADYGQFQPSITRWFSPLDSLTASEPYVAPQTCTLPVLFVFGGNSPYNEPDNRARIADMFPNAEQVVINGAGHFVHYEKPKEFVEVVAPFIAHYSGVA